MDYDGVEALEELQLLHVLAAQAPEFPFGWQLEMLGGIESQGLPEQKCLPAVVELGYPSLMLPAPPAAGPTG